MLLKERDVVVKEKRKSKIPANTTLNHRQKAFIFEYLKDRNATQAAIRAGYAKIGAQVQSSRLLSHPIVRAELDKQITRIENKVLISKEFVVKGLKEVAQRCMTHVPVMEFDHESKTMVQKMQFDEATGKAVGVYDFDSTGANKALELLGRHLALFTDRLAVVESFEKLIAGSAEVIDVQEVKP